MIETREDEAEIEQGECKHIEEEAHQVNTGNEDFNSKSIRKHRMADLKGTQP